MTIRILSLSLLLLFCSINKLFSKINLPSIFSNGMVLQQKSRVAIWGKATPSSTIKIVTSWDNASYSTTSATDGTWKTHVHTPKAGGPYSIQIQDDTNLVLSDILIGEVWLASGQSNMEMPLKGYINQPVTNGQTIIAEAGNPQIRLFHAKKVSWASPLDVITGEWLAANPASVTNFSAIAYSYAKLLQERLKVPIGIIEVAWGGTRIEAWMPANSLTEFPDLWIPPVENKAFSSKNTPTGIYNGMIAPLVGYGIKGVLWYQGETNRKNAHEYALLLQRLVSSWRNNWGIGSWDFYYAQIAPFDKVEDSSYQFFPLVREAQLKASSLIPQSGMAILTDIGSAQTVHPPDKCTVAERLALIAFAKSYNDKDIKWSGPVFRSQQVMGNKIKLFFDSTDGGLFFKNQTSDNFEIAGADQQFYTATAHIVGDTIVVSSNQVKNPIAVRYAFKPWVIGDLFNGAGLPASSFRAAP